MNSHSIQLCQSQRVTECITAAMSVFFSWYNCFLHQLNWPPQYSWNNVESDVKHRKLNQTKPWILQMKYNYDRVNNTRIHVKMKIRISNSINSSNQYKFPPSGWYWLLGWNVSLITREIKTLIRKKQRILFHTKGECIVIYIYCFFLL
jgi:hypothetical protein